MNFFEVFKALFHLPSALLHLRRINSEIKKQPQAVAEIRQKGADKIIKAVQCGSDTNDRKPSLALIKSYYWASKCISNTHCLPRSLALFQRLSNQGFAVEHRVGGYKTQGETHFHAWVEFQGKALNESDASLKKFHKLEDRREMA